jgi:antirestriction protein ArdC
MKKFADIEKLLNVLIELADNFPQKQFSFQAFLNDFGPNSEVKTPLGISIIDIDQFLKVENKLRQKYYGLIKPTLSNPLLIVKSKDRNGILRLCYIKTFKFEGTLFFVSFVDSDEELNVVSNHPRRHTQIKKILSEGQIIYQNDSITALLGFANDLKPNYKTLLISIHLKSRNKIIKNTNSKRNIMAKKFDFQGFLGLDGWEDDKEKFKIELLNDIKTFLFTKWEKPWIPSLIFDNSGKVILGFKNVNGNIYNNAYNIFQMKEKVGNSPYFITLKKLKSEGGEILDKDKIINAISFIPITEESKVTKTVHVKFRLPKLHSVINVDYVKGVKAPKYHLSQFKEHELNEYIENFLNQLKKLKRIPKVYYDQADKAYYVSNPPIYSKDEIHIVQVKQFKEIAEYYSTLFHEIIHSTNNPNRLGRGKSKLAYANEELVAEIGANILCDLMGLQYNRVNSVTYLRGWAGQAKGDKDKNLLEAYEFACDAVNYLIEGIDLDNLVPETMQSREFDKAEKAISTTDKSDTKDTYFAEAIQYLKNKKDQAAYKILQVAYERGSLDNKKLNQLGKELIGTDGSAYNVALVISKYYDERTKQNFQQKSLFGIDKSKSLATESYVRLFTDLDNKTVPIGAITIIREVFIKSKDANIGLLAKRIESLETECKRSKATHVKVNIDNYDFLKKMSSPVKKKTSSLAGIEEDKNLNTNSNDNESISFSELAKIRFELKSLPSEFDSIVGKPEKGGSIMIFGGPGAGKSTFLIMLSKAVAEQNEKVAYISNEEGKSYTMQEKVLRLKANIPGIELYKEIPDDLSSFDYAIYDSVQSLNLKPDDIRAIQKQYPNLLKIFVFQVTKDGIFRGEETYAHDVDCVLKASNGVVSSIGQKNRFGGKGEMTVFE